MEKKNKLSPELLEDSKLTDDIVIFCGERIDEKQAKLDK
jgi:hypothetical protein